MTETPSRFNGSVRGLGAGVVLALVLGLGGQARALEVGQQVANVQVRDADDQPATIPDLGSKVLALFYTDPDAKDENEPFRELLKANKLDKSQYRGLGVVNLKDSWKPDGIIRSMVRKKIAKFKSLILTDPSHALAKAWKLGDCNDQDLVIIIGRDSKVKYLTRKPMNKDERQKALDLVKSLIGDQPSPEPQP
jgi:predicted transcriptional regulator